MMNGLTNGCQVGHCGYTYISLLGYTSMEYTRDWRSSPLYSARCLGRNGGRSLMYNGCMFKVDVLFARRDSIYKTFPECDVWDVDRDVRNYEPTGRPVICHPPCRGFGNLYAVNKKRWGFKRPDDESRWPFWCLGLIVKYGGVLEHPVTSKVWRTVKPTTVVDQYWFGHKAQKRTGVFINGRIPNIPYDMSEPMHYAGSPPRVMGARMSRKKDISKAEREHTPPGFAEWLIEACS